MDTTVIYYTSNYLDKKNPYFLENTKAVLLRAVGDLPIITVSHTKTIIGDNCKNICLGDIGRSHLNIYRQILIGAKEAKTKYVAMAEDDILYSYDHFHFHRFIKEELLNQDLFFYDMNKVSLFTWTQPPMYSFRTNRAVVNQLIAPRDMLIDAMEERFERLDFLLKNGWKEEKIIKYWGDPGRYEDILGVTVRKTHEFYSRTPSVVFSHAYAYGYEYNQGKKKRLGDLRIYDLVDWGKASDVLKLYEK